MDDDGCRGADAARDCERESLDGTFWHCHKYIPILYTAFMQLTAHAYLARGTTETVESVLGLLKDSGYEVEGNPDVLVRVYTSFLMDDARLLRERAALRAVSERGRVFVIAAPTIPADAQNALLKTFEEPPAGAKFFLIVPSPETLLPTLRSRMQVLELESSAAISPVDVQAFLNASPDMRIDMLKPLLEKGDDDKRDLSGTLSFLSSLELQLSSKPSENQAALHAVYRARKYITDRGALAKALLEQAALLI